MKQMLRIRVACLAVAVACAAIITTNADGQSYAVNRTEGRARTWDNLLPILYTNSWTIHGQNGASVDISGDWGIGFGGGYNFTDHFQLNGLFTWTAPRYDATIAQSDGTTRRYSNRLDTFTISLNGNYYFLKGKLTPFVSGGMGITYLDSNIQNGVATTECWWDPFLGHICGASVPTKTEKAVSYNAGIGIRFDINSRLGLQTGYNRMWVDLPNASGGMPDFDIWRLDFVVRIP